MKRLIVCDSLYQIIVGIQLCNTLFSNDEVDFWISDHSVGTEGIVKRLSKEKIANKVTYIRTKSIIYAKNKLQKLQKAIVYGLGYKKVAEIDKYQEVIFYNGSSIVYGLLSIAERRKWNTKFSRFEEGIFSYETDNSTGNGVKFIDTIRKMFGKQTLSQKVHKYYCFFPQLKKIKEGLKTIKIPPITKNFDEIQSQLCRIFDFKENVINQKYVFFASSSDIDGHPYGEINLIKSISKVVGKDNIIIKNHPRDQRSVFDEIGIEKMDSVGIPWEVYQICSNLKGKVLVTVTSGSFINCAAMLDSENVKYYFLFPCITKQLDAFYKERTKELDIIIERLHKNNLAMNAHSISNLEQVLYDQKNNI